MNSRSRPPSASSDDLPSESAVGVPDHARRAVHATRRRAVPACHPLSGCITCSDEGVPMRVLEADPPRALAVCADEAGSRSEVMTDLVGPVSPGDRLLVHAGTALLLLDPETATGADS